MNKQKFEAIEAICEQRSVENLVSFSVIRESVNATTLLVAVDPDCGEQDEYAEEVADAMKDMLCAGFELSAQCFGWNDDYSLTVRLVG